MVLLLKVKGAVCLQPFQNYPDETDGHSANLLRHFLRSVYFLLISKINLPVDTDTHTEVAQSCLTLCDPMDCSPPGSSLRGILQARVLQWVAIFLLQGIFPTQGSNWGLPHSSPSEPPGTNEQKP